MLKYDLWFDGQSGHDIGIRMQGGLALSCPVPRVQTFQIPGRNGDLHISDGTFENRVASADCYVYKKDQVERAFRAIYAWAFGSGEYRRLVSDEDPEHYLMARVANGADVAAKVKAMAPFSLQFDCMPQRFLTSGDAPIVLTGMDEEQIEVGDFDLMVLGAVPSGEVLTIADYKSLFTLGQTVRLKVTHADGSESAWTDEVKIYEGARTLLYVGDCVPLAEASDTEIHHGFSVFVEGIGLSVQLLDRTKMNEMLGLTVDDWNSGRVTITKVERREHRIYNPTAFEAKPLYKVYGRVSDFTLTVNGHEFSSKSFFLTHPTCYDSETGAIYIEYEGGAYMDFDHVSTLSEPLALRQGENVVKFTAKSGVIDRVEVIPRWWEL
jgi:phage-related protein